MLLMETKRKILVKYRNGEKIRQISREAQISRNTIRGIVRNKEQIKEGYERKVPAIRDMRNSEVENFDNSTQKQI